ncbi:ATPase family AAA domain-containing protein FIGL1 isoform X1 [Cucurbita maxima]|uniref:ATPase family AAA domain-containing protein FIGL1 isoform X1 n=1 Tax=Cucurbita maxima TaxID=3661 RepID=A0A6J1JRK3_CUCMA|nr:ATPase family AAA domain-containing protein FIGL1 isoform X1 [Cucurbita maxima]XP_022989867.1 ATPase family AAA domain-containing protein FIGL1 isoform X1 [Cucurbita maxima]XP_022989868.1 ATPase family AAA domain-containing protein FIGL1 isoform X1 [Cucurbita maxima]
MAGKEEFQSKQSSTRSSSLSKAQIGESQQEEACWRKQVDQNLKRLQSLLFGVDLALEKGDYSAAQLLGLRLLGFLDSQTRTDVDHAFIQPIRREVVEKINVARRSLMPESDRQVFEQAKKAPGCIFSMSKEMDFSKIKQSKYFQALQGSNRTVVNELDSLERVDKLSTKAPKITAEAKGTSLYRKDQSRTSPSLYRSSLNASNALDDCIIVEKNPSLYDHTKDQGTSLMKLEEEGRTYGSMVATRRARMEISSPKVDNANSPLSTDEANADSSGNAFVTARTKLEMDARQRRGLAGSPNTSVSPQSDNNVSHKGYGMRSYGSSRRGVRGNFVPPIRSNGGNAGNMVNSRVGGKGEDALDDSPKRCLDMLCGPDGELPEKLRNLEPRLIEHISNEIMDRDPNVRWDDIAGLEHAKKCVTEMVIWPLLRPDIFKGCRSPGRGLLLFGPPGTGKTMIGKAIAGEAKATFFYISASSLTSKWIGEGEKLVRALFGVASCRQPAVIFVDEIDSLLSQRKSEGEHESSRRLKTQFLIEMEGFDNGSEQILLIGATNRPQELDEAARRRLTKRLYIPLPSSEARAWIVRNLLEKDGLFKLSKEEIDTICTLSEGYSGSDMKNLVKDASMGPLREALKQGTEITLLKKEDMRPVTLKDFENAMQEVRPSVSLSELGTYDEWNKQFGSLSL